MMIDDQVQFKKRLNRNSSSSVKPRYMILGLFLRWKMDVDDCSWHLECLFKVNILAIGICVFEQLLFMVFISKEQNR